MILSDDQLHEITGPRSVPSEHAAAASPGTNAALCAFVETRGNSAFLVSAI